MESAGSPVPADPRRQWGAADRAAAPL